VHLASNPGWDFEEVWLISPPPGPGLKRAAAASPAPADPKGVLSGTDFGCHSGRLRLSGQSWPGVTARDPRTVGPGQKASPSRRSLDQTTVAHGRVYFATGLAGRGAATISRLSVRGGEVEQLAAVPESTFVVGIAVAHCAVYWAEGDSPEVGRVYRRSLEGGSGSAVIGDLSVGAGRAGIALVGTSIVHSDFDRLRVGSVDAAATSDAYVGAVVREMDQDGVWAYTADTGTAADGSDGMLLAYRP
jgi:hypothetical protein